MAFFVFFLNQSVKFKSANSISIGCVLCVSIEHHKDRSVDKIVKENRQMNFDYLILASQLAPS